MTRYALKLGNDPGATWYAARHPSRSGPLRTASLHLAETWESPAAVQAWLDSCPGVLADLAEKAKQQAEKNWWMTSVELVAVEVECLAGEAVSLRASGPVELQGVI